GPGGLAPPPPPSAPVGAPARAPGGGGAGGRGGPEAGRAIEDAGLTYGWHNHDFELRTLPDGSVPLDHMAEAGVGLELDVAWVVKGGADPLAVIDRHGHLIRTVHVKDIAPEGRNAEEDGWADPGTGIVDWPAIAAKLAPLKPAHWIAEHDNPSDHERFARAAMAMAKATEGIPA
ncbi:MAG: sugar phosphate isomerase/epimerase family protein, partial [Hasllibacter sp.]